MSRTQTQSHQTTFDEIEQGYEQIRQPLPAFVFGEHRLNAVITQLLGKKIKIEGVADKQITG